MGKRKGIRIGAGLGMGVGIYALAKDLWGRPSGDWGSTFVYRMTGYDMSAGTWNPKAATAGLPMAAGIAISYGAAKLGLNRYTPTGINL